MNSVTQEQIASLEHDGSISFAVDGQEVTVERDDVEIVNEDIPGWLVSNEGNLTVSLEVELTDDLKKEGMARELINRIQNLRKESDFEITDRINVTVSPCEHTDEAIQAFSDYIKSQVLADNVIVEPNDGVEVDFDDFKLHILVKKV